MALTAAQKKDAYAFFVVAFGAAPGVEYLSQLNDAYGAGMTTKQIVNVFTTKSQFTSVYPNFLDPQTFATKLVNNVVKSSASDAAKAEAVADIVGALNAGWSRGDVIYQVFKNLLNKPVTDAQWGNTAKLLANEIAVAQHYTETLLGNTTDLAKLQSVIANVTPTTSVDSPAALQAAVEASGAVPSATLSANVAAVNEGNTVIFTLDTKGVPAGSQYAYSLSGVQAADVVGGALTGTATVGADGKAVVAVSLAADAATEGAETLTLNIAGKAQSVTVNDTSITPVPTYALSSGVGNVNEGNSVIFTLDTTNVAPGTQFAYTLSGVQAADVVGGALTGTATVGADGKAIVVVNLAADATTEGAETLTLNIAGKAQSVTVNDTSLTPVPTYALSSSVDNVNEGNSVTFTLDTTNVAPGTQFAYTLSGVQAADVVGGVLTGTATVGADGKAVVVVSLTADATTEGAETLTLKVAGQSANVTVNDTSLNVPQTFTTSAQDAISGTALEDTFQAEVTDSVQASATNTLSGGDKADGLGGTDRVVLTATSTTATGVTVNGFQLNNIEELEIRAYEQGAGVGGTGATLGLVNVTGLQKVLSTTSTSNVTLNNVQNLVDLSVTGNGAAGTAFTVNYSGEVTDPAAGQTQAISLNNFGETGKEGLIAVDGVETFAITTLGSGSHTELAGSTLTTLNLTLGQDLELVKLGNGGAPTVLDTLTTVSAGAADTGALRANLGGAANALTVTTGAGDDVLTVNGANANIVTTNAGADTVTVTAGAAVQRISTGAGNDTVVSASGNDVIDAGEGDDSVTTGAGNDSVNAGAGNDTIIAAGNLTKLDTIAGGEGDDTLVVTDIASVLNAGGAAGETFANVSSVKTLAFSNASNGTLNAAAYNSVTQLNGTKANAAGIDTYTFQAGINGATALNNIVNGATVNLLTGTSAAGDSLTVTHDADTAGNSLTVNVTSGSAGTDDETLATLSVADDEILTLSFNDADTTATDVTGARVDTLTIANLVAGDLTTLNLSGNGHITVTAPIASTLIKTVTSTSTGNIILSTATTATAVSVTTLGGADNITTGAGDDTINVGEGDNGVNSGAGKDTITAGAGNDFIVAGAGDDVVNAGDGNNTVFGDAGNDTINTGSGNDLIVAGQGNDVVVAGAGDDTIFAGTGNLNEQEGVDNLSGGEGNDTFVFAYSAVAGQEGLTSADTVSGGNGTDTVRVLGNVTLVDDIYNNWTSVEVLDVSAGTDTVTVNAIANKAGLNTIVTGAGNDVVTIGEGFVSSLTVKLAGGNDTVNAQSAPSSATITVEALGSNVTFADVLKGGAGANDTIKLIADNAWANVDATGFERIVVVDANAGGLDGQNGDTPNDADGLAEGGNNNGVLDAGEEAANTASERAIGINLTDATVAAGATLTVDSTALTDRNAFLLFNGAAETDGRFNVTSGNGNDSIRTGAGDDAIDAGAGNNQVFAGAGKDTITVGNGNNIVFGEAGNDTITAGTGNDTIIGGDGADTINAGTGANVFRYDALTHSNAINTDTIIGFQSAGNLDQIQVLNGLLGGNTLNFAGNFATFGASQGATQAGGTIDFVFEQDTNTLWVDLNNDGTLNANDLQIKLVGVTAIEANDVAAY